MQNDMDDLVNQWKKAKKGVPQADSIDALIKTAENRRKSSVAFHYGNMIVLSVLAIVLVLCFLFLFPFQETVSRIGVGLMVGTIVLRVIIEYFSAKKANKIDLTAPTVSATDDTLKFYEFRKKIHGPVTISLVALYTLGLGLLTQEFIKHIGQIILLFDAMYCVGGIILIWQIRKGIKKEMNDLQEIIRIKTQLTANA
jgi:Ca2+/Na+ antiporter